MDFELNEEQELLRDGLRELLAGVCSIRRVREVALHDEGAAPEIWAALAKAGWTALAVPERCGGAALGAEAIMIAAIEAGRALLPLPLTTTLLGSRALASADDGAHDGLLRGLADGDVTLTLALAAASPEETPERPALAASAAAGGSWTVTGARALVPYGPLARVAIADVAVDGQPALFLLPADAPGLHWTFVESIDATVRRFDLEANGVTLPASACIARGDEARRLLASLEREWRTMLAAETLGACEAMVDITGAYVKDRIQFGRPVGANQAVKVRIAEMAWQTGRMRAAIYNAALHIEQASPEQDLAANLAKAVTASGGAFVGTQAIHCHGGIGFTWEHDIHLYFKRAKANELFLGDASASFARLAEALV